MISKKDKTTIALIAERYKIKKIFLFGSSAFSNKQGKDIDLAVEGIQPKDFFKFYGELLFSLKKSVDLIDLSGNNKFNAIVRREGIPIYG